jgi:hypothetical protein
MPVHQPFSLQERLGQVAERIRKDSPGEFDIIRLRLLA